MSEIRIPVEVAEMLHVTLGPLSEVLKQEGHPWAPMVEKMLHDYTRARDAVVSREHGASGLAEVHEITTEACNTVLDKVSDAILEGMDFVQWHEELTRSE